MMLIKRLFFAVLFLFSISSFAQNDYPEVKLENGGYTVVLGSSETYQDAVYKTFDIIRKGIKPAVIPMGTPVGIRYRIVAGQKQNMKEINAIKVDLAEKTGISDAWVLKLNPNDIEILSFDKAYKKFTKAIDEERFADCEEFIHESHGFYVIHRPGVFEDFEHYGEFMQLKRDSYFQRIMEIDVCDLVYDREPDFSCERVFQGKNGWSKEGCFSNGIEGKTKLHTILDYFHFEHKSIGDLEYSDIKTVLDTINRIVIQTEGVIMYFSFIEGQWYLVAIDIATTDCSV